MKSDLKYVKTATNKTFNLEKVVEFAMIYKIG